MFNEDSEDPYQVAGEVVPIRPGAMNQDLTTDRKNNGGALGHMMNNMRDRSKLDHTNNVQPMVRSAIDTDPNATEPQGSAMGNQLQQQINQALGVIGNALAYGRKLHGIGGGGDNEGGIQEPEQQVAGRMPTVPGNQSESGIPPRRPEPPGGLGKQAARMPSVPASQSESGIRQPQPMPGPLPPTSNPFGKRADAGEDQEQPPAAAIDTEEPEIA